MLNFVLQWYIFPQKKVCRALVAILDLWMIHTKQNEILQGTTQWLFMYSLGSIKCLVFEKNYFILFLIGSYVKKYPAVAAIMVLWSILKQEMCASQNRPVYINYQTV